MNLLSSLVNNQGAALDKVAVAVGPFANPRPTSEGSGDQHRRRPTRAKTKSGIDAPLVGMDALVADEVALPSKGFGATLEGAIERSFAPMLVDEVVEVHREGTGGWVSSKNDCFWPVATGRRESREEGGKGGQDCTISIFLRDRHARGRPSCPLGAPSISPPSGADGREKEGEARNVERTDLQKGVGDSESGKSDD